MTSASSAHRPADWTPLADSDPTPGDPHGIRDEVTRMKHVAQSLRDQAADLRVIGHGEGLKGKYADKLRSSAMDLEKHLRQVAERYEHVHGHLTRWSKELESIQDESVSLLHKARSAEDNAKPAQHAASYPAAAHPTGDAAAPPPVHHDDPVHPYRVSLHHLTHHRNERANHYAQLIDANCNDIIKDSEWERLSGRVGDILSNRWLNDVFNVLGIIVSVVGIIALFCTPVGWILDACMAIGFAMAAKDFLAAATGNGSWFDLGLDVVGFAGGYAFGRALKSLKTIRAATKLASEGAAAEEAGNQVMQDSENVMRDTYHETNSRTSSRAARARARQTRGLVRGRAEAAGTAARATEHARPMPEPSRTETALSGGEKESAAQYKDINAMRTRYPHNLAVQQASRHAGTVMGAARGVAGVNTAMDWGSKAVGAWSSDYAHLEEKCTLAFGSRW